MDEIFARRDLIDAATLRGYWYTRSRRIVRFSVGLVLTKSVHQRARRAAADKTTP
jgi:hypothetical protein